MRARPESQAPSTIANSVPSGSRASVSSPRLSGTALGKRSGQPDRLALGLSWPAAKACTRPSVSSPTRISPSRPAPSPRSPTARPPPTVRRRLASSGTVTPLLLADVWPVDLEQRAPVAQQIKAGPIEPGGGDAAEIRVARAQLEGTHKLQLTDASRRRRVGREQRRCDQLLRARCRSRRAADHRDQR